MPTLNSDQIQDQQNTGAYLPAPSMKGHYASYTFDTTEDSTFDINMFIIPEGSQVVSLVMYHDALGNVTLTCGRDGDTDAYVQSESGGADGSGWLGQGLTVGDDVLGADRYCQVKVTKHSGSYVLGAKVKVWAITVTDS